MSAPSSDPTDLGVADAAAAIARGELSALELTRAFLGRIEAVEPVVRAWVTICAEGAEGAARDLDVAGRVRGPLHGVPVGIKDLVDVAGTPTTASSRVLQNNVATGDADIVARLRAAGAVVLGKTNLHEFAYGVVSALTRNPWDLDRIPGGSSGGSAAALAARTCAGALGSDTAGSIRIPSALCGTSGLVPRPGLLPMSRVVALAPSLDRCGPMARSVRDLELLWEGLCGRRAELPDARGLRLAVPEEPVATVADAVGAALEGAVGALSGAGVRVRTTSVGRFERWDRPRSLLLMTEALAVHVAAGWYPARSDDYGPETLASLRYAERIAPEDLGAARRTLDELRDELVGVFDVADVLVLPSAPRAAPAASEVAAGEASGGRPNIARELTRLNGPANVCGLAAVAVPCGFTSAGLPVGLQFVARDEAAALAFGSLYQSLTDWHIRRPALGGG